MPSAGTTDIAIIIIIMAIRGLLPARLMMVVNMRILYVHKDTIIQ